MRNLTKLLTVFLIALYPPLQVAHGPADAELHKVLLLRLLIPEPQSCVGTEGISGELILRNTGNRPMIISFAGLSSGVQFRSYSEGDEHSSGLKTLDIRKDPWNPRAASPKEITLSPDESRWINVNLTLERDFFSKPGLYAVSVDHIVQTNATGTTLSTESLNSNWVYFELEDCAGDKHH